MRYKVEVKKVPKREGYLFNRYAVFIAGTNLCVADDFVSVSDAKHWIKWYNGKWHNILILKEKDEA